MGRRRAMPLLSTLAALVIIVHSAEEDHDRRIYRREVMPRSFDLETPNLDEPWRSLDTEPMMQTTQHDMWQESVEEPLKRRRPARKRRRRPAALAAPETSQETYHNDPPIEPLRSYADHIPEPTHDVETYRYPEPYIPQTTEMPKRRRKRPEHRRNRWSEDYADVERPLRRRGVRRKRPSIDTWPRLSEFDFYRPEHETKDTTASYTRHTEAGNTDNGVIEALAHRDETEDPPETTTNSAPTESPDMHLKEDKSLSEFSLEEVSDPIQYKQMKNMEPTASVEHVDAEVGPKEAVKKKIDLKQRVKAEEKLNIVTTGNNPIDPAKLKEILSKSKGASLSEILQGHNLSLADLLAGNKDAISILKAHAKDNTGDTNALSVEVKDIDQNQEQKERVTEAVTENADIGNTNTETTTDRVTDLDIQSSGRDVNSQTEERKTASPQMVAKRRFREGVRRKLRMRPAINNTYKSQLNRDLMALSAKKYSNNRNVGKSKQWQYVIPLMNATETSEENDEKTTAASTTTTTMPEETTMIHSSEYYTASTVTTNIQTETTETTEQTTDSETTVKETTTEEITTTQETTTEMTTTTTEKPKVSRLRPTTGRMGLRRQAFNNRLKRKRQKQKSTTVPPAEHENLTMDLFGMPNLVSSSEFIARTQTPKPTNAHSEEEDFTTLEDFMTTEKLNFLESGPRFTRNSTVPNIDKEPNITISPPVYTTTTEDTAKLEIEEILNDTRTSARLSKILMERNMTLNELVEHRERGSSHVHLADIFHNASKEPNPPEPFLSKSLIEPISKETYPLRALLEANLHDPKATTVDPNSQMQFVNIPVVMDFGNNVNENGENMGIITLFDKYADSDVEKRTVGKDSEGTPYVTTVFALNATENNDTVRESRVLKDEEDHFKQDVAGWKQLIEVMRKNHQDDLDELIPKNDTSLNDKIVLPDSDGDGVIVLEDLQGLDDLHQQMHEAWDDKLEMTTYERSDVPQNAPTNSRSVTVATASIVGLAMILFLLTYAGFKWKQQRNMLRKKQSFKDECIPTPVFENRKGNKNNCSTRSVSPMLATSNIYTMSTLGSNNGKESPDYMWDSLRKPFQ